MVNQKTLELELELEIKRIELEIVENELAINKNKIEAYELANEIEENVPKLTYDEIRERIANKEFSDEDYNQVLERVNSLPLKKDEDNEEYIEIESDEDFILYYLMKIGIITYENKELEDEQEELLKTKKNLLEQLRYNKEGADSNV